MTSLGLPEVAIQPMIPLLVDADTEKIFTALAARWREETAYLSSVSGLITHPCYLSIIGIGPTAVPLLLRELQRQPEMWFWALAAITRENPVSPELEGDVTKMAEAWLKWGGEKGLV